MTWEVRRADCVEAMRVMDEASVDAIVTDPPYGLGFMGKEWDDLPPGDSFAAEAFRVLKPGGHLLAFGGTRTYHRLTCAIEDAGFEIRDCIAWLYGSGFPKSLNLDGEHEGWGTALKPAHEPIVVARKPLVGTVAQNVQAHGTGALNIDGCRIGTDAGWSYPNGPGGSEPHHMERGEVKGDGGKPMEAQAGRWPANVVLDEHAAELLDAQSGDSVSGDHPGGGLGGIWQESSGVPVAAGYGDRGGASRFFYCAKASRAERNAGLDGFDPVAGKALGRGLRNTVARCPKHDNTYACGYSQVYCNSEEDRRGSQRVIANGHPTVKPIDLMRWLVRLVTPPSGTVLDPFAGSGTTGCAAVLEGFAFVGIEREAEYAEIAEARIAHWGQYPGAETDAVLKTDDSDVREAGQVTIFDVA